MFGVNTLTRGAGHILACFFGGDTHLNFKLAAARVAAIVIGWHIGLFPLE